MKLQTSSFYSMLAIFLCTALVVEPVSAQVRVYHKGYYPSFEQFLPEWVQNVSTPEQADWLITYQSKTKRDYAKNFVDGIKLSGLIGFISLGALLVIQPIVGIATFEEELEFLPELTLLSLGISYGIIGFPALFMDQKISRFSISIANSITGNRQNFTSTQVKISSEIERRLRNMAGDHYAPTLTAANLRVKTKQTIQNPTIDIKVALSDDVGLSKIVFIANGQRDMIVLNGDKNYLDTKPIHLSVGENTVTISATDLYGRSSSKTFQIFRTRGSTTAATKEPTSAYYPPLLSISDISFKDEAADGFLDAGEGGTLSFHIANEGKGAATSLRVKVESPQGSGIGVSPLESPASVSPNSSVPVKYRLIGNATVPTQDVVLSLSALDQPTQSPAPEVTYHIKTRGRWSDVDLDIPRARQPNPDGVAVIIGNRDYNDPGIYPVEFAMDDAGAMKKYVLQALGYKEENVIYIQDASYSDLRSIFGTESDPQGRLHNLIFPDRSDVFIYYSGHGVPGLEDQRGYLLPANVKAEDAQKNGYSLDLLGRNLAQLPAKSVTLVVDACFSGQSEDGLLIRDASPVYIEVTDPFVKISNGSSFFASTGNEIASWFPEQKHGLFTYYFLKGIRGEADKNNDKKITVGEIENYLLELVPYRVRRLTGRSQNPVITATEKDRILARY